MSAPVEKDKPDVRHLAFFEGPFRIAEGLVLRPLSLQTMLIADECGLSIVNTGGSIAGLDEAEVMRQVSVYIWAHSAPEDEVDQAIREDTWKAIEQMGLVDRDHNLKALILNEIIRNHDLIRAAQFEALGGSKDKNPFPTHWAAAMVFTLSGGDLSREAYVRWHLPLARALLYDQCSVRSRGFKTDKPGNRKKSSAGAKKKLEKAEAAAKKLAEPSEW